MVAAFDPLRELHLLRCGKERNAADVLQEELQRICGDLGIRLDLGLDVVVRRDDCDPRFLEGGVELVQLRRLELELVQCQCDLVRIEAARAISALEEPLRLVRREDVLDGRSSGRAF
ncbi:MAG TPA: hypothetical protein VJ745_04230 [Gaiellaceae bacterium]|nr:hypothetical protein [Gaiellaceae bacterium]